MKKKILLITTGGTIASEPSGEGLTPAIQSPEIISALDPQSAQYEVKSIDLFSLDSSNIQPEEWQIIAKCVAEAPEGTEGVVITHGTDTMAYTSSALSYMLQNPAFPIVLTGSQLPLSHPLTDAKENLLCAFAMAGSGVPGVYLAFCRKVLRGTRAVKIRTMSFDAFESINCPPVARIDVGGLVIDHSLTLPTTGSFHLQADIASDVILVKMIPGLNPALFEWIGDHGCRGVVIEAFGAGGMHFLRRDAISAIQALADRGVVIVVCSQCLYEASDFTIYQTGMRLVEHRGIIQAKDMTTEAAVTKLMWCLGQTGDREEIRALFTKNLAGEIGC